MKLMNINKKAQTFFEDHALQWSIRGYNYIDHNYPCIESIFIKIKMLYIEIFNLSIKLP